MVRHKPEKKSGITLRPVSMVERLRPSELPGMNETRSLLLSNDPKIRQDGAWYARGMSVRGEDISPLGSPIISAMRAELKSGTNPMTLVYLTEAVCSFSRGGHDIEQFLSVLSPCVTHSNMHVRYNAISALADHARRGGEIGLNIESLVSRLEDMSQAVQEISLAALRIYASSGPLAAHQVTLCLGSDDSRLMESARERRSELREHCESVLGKK